MNQIVLKIALVSSLFPLPQFICLDKTMFEGEKICDTSVTIDFLFEENNLSILKEYFCCDEIIKSMLVTHCDKKNKEDKMINWYDSYLDIQYREEYADIVYSQLLSYCRNPTMKNRLFSFFKPGKLICLNESKNELRIISFNTCANMSKLEKMVDCIKKSNNYDKVFAIRCGVYDGIINIK